MRNLIPAWNGDEPTRTARLAIAVLFGNYFIRDTTDEGDMQRQIHDRMEDWMRSMVYEFLKDCPPPLLDAIEVELSTISLETPRTHPLVELSNDYGTSWRYRYDALHPFFVGVCADLLVRLRKARTEG